MSAALEPPQPDSQRTERRIIERLLEDRTSRPEWVRVDAGDDCAVVQVGGDQAITTDTLVEGVHFDDRLTAADVGFKAVAVSVSDLAAGGALPTWMVLALSLPPNPLRWVDSFATGLAAACERFGVTLVGGDVTRSPGPRWISVTAAGICEGAPLLRSGARPGHRVWVTGAPGLAGAGWLLDDPPDEALEALRRPAPPLQLALGVARNGLASAAMDLSDGLAADAPRLARASGVALTVDPGALPIPACLAGHPRLLECQLAAGDDFQLLFTAPDEHEAAIRRLSEQTGTDVTPIGRVEAGAGARLTSGAWPTSSFSHFAAEAS